MTERPYQYRHRPIVEPDWRRFPAWRRVTDKDWRDARWQRRNSVRSLAGLRQVVGDGLSDSFLDEVARDQLEQATMPLLIPPHTINSFGPTSAPGDEVWREDPQRRSMLPLISDRLDGSRSSHPMATRDSLHEADMWAVEGLTHRYPTKVLVELTTTCSQYCGFCTRMDLVGPSTQQVEKRSLSTRSNPRWREMIDYISANPQVRDVVVSGGDVANVPWPRLERFVAHLLDIPSVRDIRLASKAVVDLPQHWLTDEARWTMERLATRARNRGTALAVHTHANHVNALSPLAAEVVRSLLDAGVRDVRNQGVLMANVNDTAADVLDLCYGLLDTLGATPYYFYMCDMIPNAEHWRTTLATAMEIQDSIMGHLPGFATPRLVCDVPFVGKKWVHQATDYDVERGVSTWRSSFDPRDDSGRSPSFPFFDPIHLLPPSGQEWWDESEARIAE